MNLISSLNYKYVNCYDAIMLIQNKNIKNIELWILKQYIEI